jgi:Protein of unknown function (DUF1761)
MLAPGGNPMQINPWAVLAAALVNFVIGGLWYSPLVFGKLWMKANGFSAQDLEKGSPAVIFGVSFVLCLVMAGNLAAFLGDPSVTMGFAVAASVAAGLGWAAAGLAVVALFERRSGAYILVNGGYLTVSFVAMGVILGAWR